MYERFGEALMAFFLTNHHCPWNKAGLGILLDPVVHGDDVEDVQQLSLVLMDPLDLHVIDGRGVDLNPRLVLQIRGQVGLVLLFHFHHFQLERQVRCQGCQITKLIQVPGKIVTYSTTSKL